MTEIMTKNRETKSLLAKLMASEDINVEYRESATTAAFDTEGRTLIMPVLKDMTENATDLFLGHEVGHALYTPQGAIKEVLEKGGAFKGVVNIVEDARIEKMIQLKFPGLKKNFYEGYGDLVERGFFDIKDRDVNELKFIDRINIHFKVGIRAGVEFSDEEMTIVDKISNLRSFDDSLKVSEELYGYCKDNAEEPQPDFGDDNFEFGDDDSGDEDVESNDGEMSTDAPMNFDEPEDSDKDDDKSGSKSGETDEDSEENAEEKAKDGKSDGDDEDTDDARAEDEPGGAGPKPTLDSAQQDALKSETQEAFDSALKDHLDDSGNDYHYGNIPKVDIKKVLVSMEDVHKEIDETIALRKKDYDDDKDYISSARESFNKFRSEQKSIISYMAKEFEMRKSADEHSRTREGKTGVLNPNKLHAYKFSEDLFLRSNIVAAGKNHGFVMFVDWSGSMANNMANTIDQLTLLALFCKKVNIPFDVFAFTTAWGRDDGRQDYYTFDDRKEGDFGVTANFSLLHLISSTLSTAKFNTSMIYLRYMREAFGNRGGRSYDANMYYPIPGNLNLGGTPLNEAVIAAMEIVPMFQKKNNVQIVNTIFLTDGQGTEQRVTYNSENGGFEHGLGYGRAAKNIIVDPITKRHYNITRNDKDTKYFLEALKDRTGNRIAGFFIAPSRMIYFRREVNWILGGDSTRMEELHDEMKKNSFAVIEGDLGYDQFYVLSDKDMNVDAKPVEFDSDMTKGRMKNAFVKSRKNKIANKAMLSKFAEFVS